MKIIFSLLFVSLLATPVFAQQALILTEIEQIQEKIWYLQRDVAAQKSTLENHQADFNSLHAKVDKGQKETNRKLNTLTDSLNELYEKNEGMAASLQSLKETVTSLNDAFNQQNAIQLQQAEKSGAQEGKLRALREEIVANQTMTEKALAETERKLKQVSEQLKGLQQQTGRFDQLGLYLGGAALALVILLTIGFAFLNNRTKNRYRGPDNRPDHEL